MELPARFNPFPGLRSFAPDEDHLFFGREKEIDELLRRLRTTRFLSVVGTSGSGKSSLVLSGLIPSLYSGFMVSAGSGWRVAILRPGENPIKHLAAALSAPDVLGKNEELGDASNALLEATLRRSTLGVVEAARQAMIPHDDNLLIVVDQFEELFRFRQGCQNESLKDEAVEFVKLLLEATQQEKLPIYVVLTMRSDFIGDCMEYPGLPEAVNAGMYLVPRMTRDELRSAITGPVAVGGGQIAPRFVLRLLNDVGDDQDQLPLLQHALMRAWDNWQSTGNAGEPIDIANYEAIGTIRHALSRHAEEAYLETGTGKGHRTAERMFKALTDTYSDQRGVRRPTPVHDLAEICDVPESEIIQIVEIFRARGRSFLTPPADVPLDTHSIIDISHESLMRCWIRLIVWAEEERRSADFYIRLSKASAWYEEGVAGLWRDPELEFGLQWWVKNDPTMAWAQRYDGSFMSVVEFLDRSKRDRERVAEELEKEKKKKLRQARTIAATSIVAAVILLFLFIVAVRESRRAEANLQLAKNAVDESLSSAAASAQRASEVGDPPQLEEFRQKLLNKAEVLYSNFLAIQSRTDPQFRLDSALLHSKLGDILRLQGKGEEAVEQYKGAISGFESLLSENPGNLENRRALGNAHTFLGETLRRWSEKTHNAPDLRPAALKEYDSALTLQKGLFDASPQKVQYQQELARTYDNRGILHWAMYDAKNAESDFNEAVRLLEPIASAVGAQRTNPDEVPPAHDLVLAYNNLSILLENENQRQRAQGLSERSIRILEDLAQKAPDNWGYREELVIFRNNLAPLAFSNGDKEVAKQQNRLALDGVEQLATLPPEMENARAYAHMFYPNLGSPDHPEFHVLYMHLGDEYVSIANDFFMKHEPAGARLAIQSLGRILPQVDEPYRQTLEKQYEELQKLLENQNNNK